MGSLLGISQNLIEIIMLFLIIIVIIALYFIGWVLVDRKMQKRRKDIERIQEHFSRDDVYLENEINSLKLEVNKLNNLNDRYLNFTQKLTEVVKHLYASLSFQDITSTVIRLVKDIINTKTIEMYILDTEENLLRRVNQLGRSTGEEVAYALGEGLIGKAGKDGFATMKGSAFNGLQVEDLKKTGAGISMAFPIFFKTRLLGVIGIGEIRDPTGNEHTLLKMISDIAGVALSNQTYLKEWKDGAITDPLTGLYNRRYFFYMTLRYAERAVRENIPISVCMFDIDNFKNYNDTNGHQAGDRILREFSGILTKLSRKTSVVARYGGEEFIVLLPDIAKDEAFIFAQRVQKEIADYPFLHREKQPLGFISVSGGVATSPGDASTIEQVIQLADKALYRAKREGKNRIEMHKPFLFSDKSVEYK